MNFIYHFCELQQRSEIAHIVDPKQDLYPLFLSINESGFDFP